MYRGFSLQLIDSNSINNDNYYIKGKSIYNARSKEVEKSLAKYINAEGSLDGTKMQSDWFPQVDADVFISHSHKDKKMAICLAGFLYNEFRLKSFIDSCIWGHSNDLLKQIDNSYCLKKPNFYSYEKRNESTSHVHMMLSTALSMMIDKTECLFFLNTPNSITSHDVISKTKSAWIYSELSTSLLIRKKSAMEHRTAIQSKFHRNFVTENAVPITHSAPTEHLSNINYQDLIVWQQCFNSLNNNQYHPLDFLYEIADID